jgi:hypothetical protein
MAIEKQFVLKNKGPGAYTTGNPITAADLINIRTNTLAVTLATGEVKLDNQLGRVSGFDTPLSFTSYSIVGDKVAGGYHRLKINAASQPTVTDGTLIPGAQFQANTDMEMIVESPDGSSVQYFFLNLI